MRITKYILALVTLLPTSHIAKAQAPSGDSTYQTIIDTVASDSAIIEVASVLDRAMPTRGSEITKPKKTFLADNCTRQTHPFKPTQLIAPLTLAVAGVAITAIPALHRGVDVSLRDAVLRADMRKSSVDDYLQFAPIVGVYGLNVCGVRGLHNYRDLTVMMATSSLITGAMVYGLKYSARVLRPDGSTYNSFPSGHTAIAFMGAEFLRQEYKHLSPWYGVAGYLVAGATGAMRIYNNRHWMSDVLAGAAFGILGAKIAYWIYPSMRRWLFPDKGDRRAMMVLPYYNGRSVGVGLCAIF